MSVTLPALCALLADGEPAPVVCETHLSEVVLTRSQAFKRCKPVVYPFVDHRDVAQRERTLREEMACNAELAPGVYQGVLPVRLGGGVPALGPGPGEVVDHLLVMRRLPDAATLRARLDALTPADIARVGRHLAAFHLGCAPPRRDWDARAARRARTDDNLEAISKLLPGTLSNRLRIATARAEARLGEALDRRPQIDGHGDLRLEHLYDLPDGIVVLDRIAFDPELRWGDPAADLAFLVMELARYGRADLGPPLLQAWSAATGERDLRDVLAYYVAYRAAVRAKVRLLRAAPGDVDHAAAHVRLALAALEDRGPLLVAIGGLPGSGKSTLARTLCETLGLQWVRSDAVRETVQRGPDRYSGDARDRVYAACLDHAEPILAAGGRVLLDATFTRPGWPDAARAQAVRLGIPFVGLWCEAPLDVLADRVRARTGDLSDADESVLRALAASAACPSVFDAIATDGTPADALRQALTHLDPPRTAWSTP